MKDSPDSDRTYLSARLAACCGGRCGRRARRNLCSEEDQAAGNAFRSALSADRFTSCIELGDEACGESCAEVRSLTSPHRPLPNRSTAP